MLGHELRLECVRLAIQSRPLTGHPDIDGSADAILEAARKFADFIGGVDQFGNEISQPA